MLVTTIILTGLALTPPTLIEPFTADGDTYVFAQASGSGNINNSVDLKLPMFLLNPYNDTVSASNGVTHASALVHILLDRKGAGWKLDITGEAEVDIAAGQFAFGRADAHPSVDFHVSQAGAVQVQWESDCFGIASGSFMIQKLPLAVGSTILEQSVSCYITPQTNDNQQTLNLAAGDYRVRYYGSVQANSSFMPDDGGGYHASITLTHLSAGDLTGDGMVDGADLGIMLGAWGTADADLSGDGTTDGADLGMLLAVWSQ